MTEIRFYHLQKQNLDQALPQILTKALSAGHKILVKLPDADSVKQMDQHLWVYDANSFLPHGCAGQDFEADQPILLTHDDTPANDAKVLITGRGSVPNDTERYDLVCEMLDGFDNDAITAARARWKTYKDQGLSVTYWKQSETGRWEEKS